MSLSLVFHALVLLLLVPSEPPVPPPGARGSIEVRLITADDIDAGTPVIQGSNLATPTTGDGNHRNPEAEPPGVTQAFDTPSPRRASAVYSGLAGAPAAAETRPRDEEPTEKGPFVAYEPPEPAEVITPQYPSTARRRRQEGSVRLRVFVDDLGRVRDVSVLESSGVSSLDAAAQRAASAALFRPARTNGEAVPSSLRLTVIFALEGDSEG